MDKVSYETRSTPALVALRTNKINTSLARALGRKSTARSACVILAGRAVWAANLVMALEGEHNVEDAG